MKKAKAKPKMTVGQVHTAFKRSIAAIKGKKMTKAARSRVFKAEFAKVKKGM
jgi:hypothetical protein